jgi:hypothetical protein
LQNVGYLSSYRPTDVQKPFLVKNAPLLIRAFVVLIGVFTLWLFRKNLSKKFVLFVLWTLFALFAVTLSERPYPHYLLQAAAPISLMLGVFFAEKTFEQSLVVIPLALTLFVPVYYHYYDYSTYTYYSRFINFATGKIDKQTYFSQFSKYTNRNYQIAWFLSESSRPADRVFMFDSDSAAIYALARRLPPIKYVVDYHILDFSSKALVANQLMANPPMFIILTHDYPYPEISAFLKERYILIQQIEDATIYIKKTTS